MLLKVAVEVHLYLQCLQGTHVPLKSFLRDRDGSGWEGGCISEPPRASALGQLKSKVQ